MKKSLFIVIIFLGFLNESTAQKCHDMFTIYLVRHSEKDMSSGNYSDPPLTECGEERSEYLKTFLSEVALDAVYSTNYIRTKSTALSTALSKGLEIIEYNPNELEEFSKQLIALKQDALVVGHSNTTGVLAGLLSDEEIGDIDLDIYNRIYQVVIYKNNSQLNLFHTSFECQN